MSFNKIFIFKVAGVLSRPIFLFFPKFYYYLYSLYKVKSDQNKISLIKKYVKSPDVVIDIGAYIGFYTNYLASIVGKEGKVYAFEPSPENYKFLLKNTSGQPQVENVAAALGSKSGQTTIYLSKILNVDNRTYETDEKRQSATVPQVSLDDFLQGKPSVKTGFIKMDIQGAEFLALQGMRETLKRDKPVIFTELWPWGLSQAGSSSGQFIEALKSQGYEIFIIDESNGVLSPVDADNLGQREENNYDILCLPKG